MIDPISLPANYEMHSSVAPRKTATDESDRLLSSVALFAYGLRCVMDPINQNVP